MQNVGGYKQYLISIFDVTLFSQYQQWILIQFAVLPSQYINYRNNEGESLIELLQIGKQDNLERFPQALAAINNLGWLQRDNYAFHMHPVLQEVISMKCIPTVNQCSTLIDSINDKLNYYDFNKAIRFISFGLKVLNSLTELHPLVAKLYQNVSIILLRTKDVNEGIKYQKMSIEQYEKLVVERPELKIELSESYNGLALLYYKDKDFSEALKIQLKDLEIVQQDFSSESYEYGITCNNLSLMYRELKRWDEADKYQQEAIRIAKATDDKELNLLVYNNMGNLYFKRQNYSEALPFFKQALAIRKMHLSSDDPWLADTFHNLATTYIELHELDKARENIENCLIIYEEKLPNTLTLAESYIYYAAILYKLQEPKKAQKYLNIANTILLNHYQDSKHPQITKLHNIFEELTSDVL